MLTRRELLLRLSAASAVLPSYLYGAARSGDIALRAPAGSPVGAPLRADERALIAAMAEGIIPATDTPGAIGAGVPEFIEMLYAEWFTAEEQKAFSAGLVGFASAGKQRFGCPFPDCKEEQQALLLTEWDHAVAVARAAGKESLPPFAQFKALVVVGYYTSKVGQNEELHAILDAGERDPNGPVMMPVPFHL